MGVRCLSADGALHNGLEAKPLLKVMNFQDPSSVPYWVWNLRCAEPSNPTARGSWVQPRVRSHNASRQDAPVPHQKQVCVCNTTHASSVALGCKGRGSNSSVGNQRRSPHAAFGAAEGGPGARQRSQQILAVPCFPVTGKATAS